MVELFGRKVESVSSEQENPIQEKPEGTSEDETGKPRKSRSELLREFAEEVAKVDGELINSWEIDGLLYDEYGLPK
jgi:hypothetical protein